MVFLSFGLFIALLRIPLRGMFAFGLFFANCCRVNALFLGFCYYLHVLMLRIKEILVKFPFFWLQPLLFSSFCQVSEVSFYCKWAKFPKKSMGFFILHWLPSGCLKAFDLFLFCFFCFFSKHSPLLHVTTIALGSYHWLCATGCQDILATRDYFLSHLSYFFMSVGVFFRRIYEISLKGQWPSM